MGLFDASFSPYGGGLLGSLGVNDLASLARSYGGYQPTQDDPGFETSPAADKNRAKLNGRPNQFSPPDYDMASLIGAYPTQEIQGSLSSNSGPMPRYTQNDIDALIHAYDPNSSARALQAAYSQQSTNPKDYAGLETAFGAPSKDVYAPQDVSALTGAYPSSSWLKAGGVADRILRSPMLSGISPLAPPMSAPSPPTPMQQGPSFQSGLPMQSGAEPSVVWVGPQQMMPMPQPRPPGLGQPQPPQGGLRDGVFGGDLSQGYSTDPNSLAQSSMGGGYGGRVFPSQPQQNNAALSPNVQPAQQTQAPQAMQPLGDKFMAGINNLNSGGNPITMLANVAQGFSTGQRLDRAGVAQQNQSQMAHAVATGLIKQGYRPEIAIAIARAAGTDPKLAEKLLGDAFATPKTMEELVTRQAAQGQTGGAQGGAQGGAPSTPTAIYEDFLKRKSAATKAGEVTGETQANAEMNLPSAVAQSKEALRLAGDLRNHKGREGNIWWHGKMGAYLPDSSIPGNTDARDAVGILGQLKGGAFLEAFKALKGGGAITEIEGKKATDAIARMDRSQSKAEFDKSLSDYEGIVRLGIDRANQMAGKSAPNNFKGNSEWQTVKPGVRIRQVQ